jgi:hypothetical protein
MDVSRPPISLSLSKLMRYWRPTPGRFVVYRAGKRWPDGTVVESQPPPGSPRRGMQVALTYFEKADPDLSDPDPFSTHARRMFAKTETDARGLLALEDH